MFETMRAIAATCVLAALFSSNALAQSALLAGSSPYVHLFGGANQSSGNYFGEGVEDDNNDDVGYVAGFAVGVDFGRYRGELELATRQNKGQAGSGAPCDNCAHAVSVDSLMVNALADFQLSSAPGVFSAGIGIGAARVQHSILGQERPSKDSSAAQLILQYAHPLSATASIVADYRLFHTFGNAPEIPGSQFGPYTGHSLSVGLLYSF